MVAYKQFQARHGGLLHLGLPGIWAFAQPSHPDVLSPQQVIFEDPLALEAALPQLEDFYRGHDVQLWRVLVPPGVPAQPLLERAGYKAEEGGNTAMGISLADTSLEPPERTLEKLATLEELIPLNADAFGPGTAIHLQAWHSGSYPHIRARGLREHGLLAAAGLAHDWLDTAGIYLVATSSSTRGRGLATEVMRGLLLEARARGLAAAVLQSTELGYGVYRRVGMRDLGLWVNWVRRLG